MLGSGDNFRRFFFVARKDIKRAHEERMVKTDSFSCEKHQESRCCQFAPCQPRSYEVYEVNRWMATKKVKTREDDSRHE